MTLNAIGRTYAEVQGIRSDLKRDLTHLCFLLGGLHQEIVGRGRAVMLLRVEPTRGDVGVPGQCHAALGLDLAGSAGRRLRQNTERTERRRPRQNRDPDC